MTEPRVFTFKPKGGQPSALRPGSTLPRLLADKANPDKTVADLKEVLAPSHEVFDRGVLVRVAHDTHAGGASAHELDPDGLTVAVHRVCRPYKLEEGVEIDIGLPRQIAAMYLNYRDLGLPPLNGIATAPLLSDDGSIRTARGYDTTTGLFCEGVPNVSDRIPARPTRNDAESAFASVRRRFCTLPFADAEIIDEGGVAVVDVQKNPGVDESSFLSQLLGAVARPSLWLCPGLAVHGARLSGSGAGKGLAVRCVMEVACGRAPFSLAQVTVKDELDKQVSAALIDGGPSLLLDNFNNMTLTSSSLETALTERPSRVRIFGKLKLVPLNALTFIAVTGNGLTLSRDIVRRFIRVELDARVENPETRAFTSNLLQDLKRDRVDALVELLTIWRWGRIASLKKGLPFGSYEQWAEWVRDPLIELGCKDPVERLRATKAEDPERQRIANAFSAWWHILGSMVVTADDICREHDILDQFDPPKRSRQYVAVMLAKHAGTRVGGFVLRRKRAVGKWSADHYVLESTNEHEHEHEDWVRIATSE